MEPCRTWPAGAPPPLLFARSKLPFKVVLDDLIPWNQAGCSSANVVHCTFAPVLIQLMIAMTNLINSMQVQAHSPVDQNNGNNKDSNNNNDNDKNRNNEDNEEDPVNENNDDNNNDNYMPPQGFQLLRRGDIARDAFIVRHFVWEAEDTFPCCDDYQDEMSLHSSDAWSQRGWDTESDSFHSSDNWSWCAEERTYDWDSELEREFNAIDWRPETPPSIGALYSSMHDDLNSRPLVGTAPVSCANGTLPTMLVGDLARRIIDHSYACSCRHDKHTYTPISDRARNPAYHKHTHYTRTRQNIANCEFCEEAFEKGCRALPASNYGQKS